MPNASIKIFVIIPVYNAKKYLKKCLQSVVEQSYSNWEAFIVDDASTDGSFDILSQFAQKDNRIKIYRNDVNKGPGYTRNRAIEYILKSRYSSQNKERYIVFLDSDDWIEKDYFLSIVQVAYQDKADIIFVDVVQEDESGNFIKNERMSAYKGKSKDIIIRHQMTGKLPWGGCRKAVRKDLIVENNIRYSSNAIGEEAIYSFKLLYYAEKIAFIENPLYHYVIHPNSQSGKRDDDPWGVVCREMENYLKKTKVYDKYKNTLTSLAFTSLIVSIYRIVQYYDFWQALKRCRTSLNNYRNKYGFIMDKESLEIRTRFVLPFAKINMVFPIVLLAKIKAFIQGS